MIDPNQDRELQRALLYHPAWRAGGVDPLWRWIAIMLMVIVAVLVAAVAKGAEVTGGKVASGRLERPEKIFTERWLDALEEVESGKDARAVGDHGRSLGSFQFKRVAWEQVNRLRRSKVQAVEGSKVQAVEGSKVQAASSRLERQNLQPSTLNLQPYSSATNRIIAREYARHYLGWLHSYLTRALHRSPTYPELYAVWNLGPAGFRARGFDLRRCPEHVRKAARRFQEEGCK